MLEEIPIIKKTYELYKLYYGFLELFPKKDKYALGAKCELYIITVLELLLEARNLPREEKIAIVRQASVKFDTLKILLRMAKDLNFLENKKYLSLQAHIQEIGRQLGGWQKSLS